MGRAASLRALVDKPQPPGQPADQGTALLPGWRRAAGLRMLEYLHASLHLLLSPAPM